MPSGERFPRVGDTLIVKGKWVGIVRKIELDKWGHQEKVFVLWQGAPGPNYHSHYGYSGVNIHNLRSEFDLVRDGAYIQ